MEPLSYVKVSYRDFSKLKVGCRVGEPGTRNGG